MHLNSSSQSFCNYPFMFFVASSTWTRTFLLFLPSFCLYIFCLWFLVDGITFSSYWTIWAPILTFNSGFLRYLTMILPGILRYVCWLLFSTMEHVYLNDYWVCVRFDWPAYFKSLQLMYKRLLPELSDSVYMTKQAC